MTRQERYPDTTTFCYYNANPKNRKGADCVIRAICTALDQSWEQTVRELTEIGIKYGYVLNDKNAYSKYLESKGWRKRKQPRKPDNTKYTGKEFCRELDCNIMAVGVKIIAHIGGNHIVCIKEDGQYGLHKVHDIWDSTDGCIGNYWTKG